MKKLIIPNIPYLLFVWLFDKAAQAFRLSPGADLSGKLLSLGTGFSAAFSNAAPSLHPMDLLIGIAGAVLIRLIVYFKGKNAKKYRRGMEYGSARWGNAEDIKPYVDPVFENNVILTQTERLMMSSRPKQPKYARNKNILVIGGSGSGKTRFFVKPNLMQMHRLGERAEHIEEIARMFQMKNLVIEGAFTHLCADESTSPKDRTFTEAQGKAFYQVISTLKEQGCSCPKVHLLASYGLINYPELSGDYARIGIALYGVLSNRSDIQKCKTPLLPVLSIKVRIAAIKDLFCGEGVGYGLSYTATENRKIAILPIGYADGIPRALSCGNGNVLIKGNIAPIIGRICMDQTIIDITDIPTVKEGDIAIIIGKSGNAEITAYDIAEQTGTITNEILSRLGSRLDRFII